MFTINNLSTLNNKNMIVFLILSLWDFISCVNTVSALNPGMGVSNIVEICGAAINNPIIP